MRKQRVSSYEFSRGKRGKLSFEENHSSPWALFRVNHEFSNFCFPINKEELKTLFVLQPSDPYRIRTLPSDLKSNINNRDGDVVFFSIEPMFTFKVSVAVVSPVTKL